MYQHKQAFTLIELLVVVLIIGILAAVALPQYQVAVTKSKYANLKHLTESILQAEEVYFLANGKYSNRFEELDVSMPAGKLETSTYNSYVYDWGHCFLYVTKSSAYFNCHNSDIGMTYQVRPKFSKLEPGDRQCVIQSTDNHSVQAKVCKQETGNYSDISEWKAWGY